MASLPGQSSASLISTHNRESGDTTDSTRDDDEAHLTANMSRQGAGSDWSGVDAERSGVSPGSRRRTVRYSDSPLKKTGTTLKTMSRNLQRASLRVVNFGNGGLEDHARLDDLDEGKREREEDEDVHEDEVLPDLSKSMPIRGRTLGFFGPRSRVRLAMYKFLLFPWTEPIILLLIIVNAVVLTIQASRNHALPEDFKDDRPPPLTGYFHRWEDYALFGLFCLFTLESFARICVSGFLLDPEVPVSTFFSSPFASYPDIHRPPNTAVEASFNLNRTPSHAGPPLRRGATITQRLRNFRQNLARPFMLAHNKVPPQPTSADAISKSATPSRARSDTVQSKSPMIEKVMEGAQAAHAHMRNPSEPTFFAKALRSDNPSDTLALPFRLSVADSKGQTQRNLPYLRHSWTRIDFLAIVGFWVAFGLAMAGIEHGKYHIGVFRALSVLRTARLLAITSGTTTIMRSLKTARPLLASVAYFVLFAMILFSIIGIQSFGGSFRRTCQIAQSQGDPIQLGSQFCGGYIDPNTLEEAPYINADGTNATIKGYICPLGQTCKESGTNPQENIQSFDAIYFAALQVIIVSSANGWSPLMYQMMDSEFFVSCVFFIICIVVLNFWLINLFVAVITNTFSAIRSDTKKSAFGAAPLAPVVDEQEEGWSMVDGRRVAGRNRLRDIYENIRWCWVGFALLSVVLQATRTVNMSDLHQEILDKGELALTITFDVEIVIRVLAYLPDWRKFFFRGQNLLDLFLAIGTTVIQIPAIHNSKVYPWLTFLQLMRFYRVILEIPRMKPLLLAVFGNMYGLANMSLFLIEINLLVSLVAVQLLSGDVKEGEPVDFGTLYNAFIAIYQIFSSENWTDVLYQAAKAEIPLRQSIVTIFFIAGWMFFANYIVLQMFIAVINENFDVAEESKRSRQASHYWASHRPQQVRAGWLRKLNPYRWLKAQPKAIEVELPSNLVLPMQKALVQDYTLPKREGSVKDASVKRQGSLRNYSAKSTLRKLQRLFAGEITAGDVPMTTLRNTRRDSTVPADAIDEETERHLEVLAALNNDTVDVEELNDAMYERRAQKADFIRDHPTYDKTFWIFSQKNWLRRMCQKLVAPAGGDRIFGIPHSPIAHPIFQLILLLTVVAGIVVESIATPLYRRQFYKDNGLFRGTWFDIAEGSFALMLLLEFIIKIVADGFSFTPNAYVRSIWNVLDFFILAGVLINSVTGLIFIGGLSRITRSLKALRALRLITLVEKMRSTFESLIISGIVRILDAALLAILYMIPYAVWGLNIFAGITNQCNDTGSGINSISDCVNEFSNNAALDGTNINLPYLVPRVWDNPQPSTKFSFDTFRQSLLILFEIVSLEGWIDVLGVVMGVRGEGLQPVNNASVVNSIFFLIYNLLGGVVIFTLFVSIIIGNFTSKTGSALLTQPQREWIDLQKLIKRQRPSKRPKRRPTWAVRRWCFDRAVHKHGWWSRMMTTLFALHIIALMTQTFSQEKLLDDIREGFFIAISVTYCVDVLVRLYGLGWTSYTANGWNMFDVVVAFGSFFTQLIVHLGASSFLIDQLQKLFITCIALKLVQRVNSLNKLFKTAVGSLPVILSLLTLWVILFIFFAILYVEVFSLTKFGTGETRNMNYTSMANALVMLAFMTTGEGWNQFMHDYASDYPRCTISSDGDTDCGSVGWAFVLFIAWNLLSMYIFANLFTGVVVESFYYVFQMSGGAKSITREEMRAFKKVWAEFANPRTGYLERHNFVRFFGRLSGIFEVKIYPTEHSIPRIMAMSRDPHNRHSPSEKIIDGFDFNRTEAVLGGLDRPAMKRRKNLYNRLYHEARISHEPGKGISFTNMLLLLAHHKLIVDREALVLKDLVVRTETNKLVTDLVDFDRVQSLLLMILYRRRYVAQRDQARMQYFEQPGVPAIMIDDTPATPPLTTRDITSPFQTPVHRATDMGTPMSMTPGLTSADISLTVDTPSRPLQRRQRTSDASMLSIDAGSRLDGSMLRDSRASDDDFMSSMNGSMWNDMMLEAAEEDKD
ncbi:Ion transport protein-domain-containing protein [Epithele typhae]|uniref:Ion transport protein-domain-containing protein n=1 Tax=Epithele typhae TaxID=378194 RepID=UPI0020084943|nr:Ion transport protein-domain-containing protein [Epithele typhae]KAH9939624.1 Ion transport protein-domain-containing protein [Epithele typhae]